MSSIKELRVEIGWQPSNYASLFPLVTFHFEKLKLKIYANSPQGQAYITSDFPFNTLHKQHEKFPEFLDNLASDKDSERQSAVDLRDSKDWTFQMAPINLNNIANPTADRAQTERLLVFAGFPSGTSNGLSFSTLIGAILSHAFLFSTGGTIFYRKKTLIEQVPDGVKTLELQMRDSVQIPAPLDPDGWNLAEYLFNLKNSSDFQERNRFRFIQEAFKALFPILSFDVIYQTVRSSSQIAGANTDFRYPSVILFDGRNAKQFSIDKVGAGISETLFLLTASFGSKEYVILLDEPAVNLHPAQMKALFQMLGNSPNQFLIITHSPILLHNILFEKGASLVYVRRPDSKSVVCTLNPQNLWPDNELYKSSYIIDPRIFFARHVLLAEGESDKYFLEASAEAFGFSPDTYEDIVVSAESKSNFPRYKNLLERLAIPYVVIGDGDKGNEEAFRKSAAAFGSEKDYTIIDSDTFPKKLGGRVFLFKDKVEAFLQSIYPDLYAEVKKSLDDNGLSGCKPVFMHEFVAKLCADNSHFLNTTIKPLLEYAFRVNERKTQLASQA